MTYFVRNATVVLDGTVALDDVSLEVEPGSVVAVVGGDGAGKTTLLRSLVGEVPLLRGEVRVPPPESLGYLPASTGSWSALTVAQNMDFVGGIYGLTGDGRASRRTALLTAASLQDSRNRLAAELSGGMRRKLGFSMTMLHQPLLLVLDEPSTGIDPVSRIDLWRLVSDAAAAGAAVVMSTTYLDEAERAGGLVVLDRGRVLASGTLDSVLGSIAGVMTVEARPRRPEWSWRRGPAYHEYWPRHVEAPVTATVIEPDLEDVVIALSLLGRQPTEPA